MMVCSLTISSITALTPEQKEETKKLLNDRKIDFVKKGEIISLKQYSEYNHDYQVIKLSVNEISLNGYETVEKIGYVIIVYNKK